MRRFDLYEEHRAVAGISELAENFAEREQELLRELSSVYGELLKAEPVQTSGGSGAKSMQLLAQERAEYSANLYKARKELQKARARNEKLVRELEEKSNRLSALTKSRLGRLQLAYWRRKRRH